MKEKITSSYILNDAAKAGAVLGGVSIAYMFAVQLMSALPMDSVLVAFLANILSLVLWGVKFWGCITLMRLFMIKLVNDYDGVTNRDTFKFGMFTALFSALLFAGVQMANILFISADLYQEQIDTLSSQFASVLDSNTLSAMESMIENYSTYSFFSTFIWCFLFGTVLSSILSKKIPFNDPFAEFNNTNNSEQ